MFSDLHRSLPVQNPSLAEWIDKACLAQTQLQQWFVITPELLGVLDPQGIWQMLSPLWQHELGWAVEDLQEQSWLTWIHPADRAASQRQLEWLSQQKQGTILRLENRMRDRSRRDRHLQWTITHGENGWLYAVARPLPEPPGERSAPVLLRTQSERLHAIFEQIEVGINLCDIEGRYIQVNPAFCNLTGYSEAELLTMNFRDLTHPEDLALDGQLAQQLATNQIQAYSLEKRYVCRNEQVRWVKIHTSRIHQGDDGLEFVVTIVEDVGDRKQVETELRQSEERFRLLTDHIRTVFYIYTVDLSQFIYISPAYETIWQQPCETLYRDPYAWLDNIHPEDREQVRSNLQRQRMMDEFSQEYRLIQPNGAVQWIWDWSSRVYDETGRPIMVVGTAEDITARKQAEIMLRQQARRDRLRIEIMQHIRQSLDLSVILEATVTQLQVQLQLSRALIYRLHPDHPGQVIAEAVSESSLSMLGQPLPDACIGQQSVMLANYNDVPLEAEVCDRCPCTAIQVRTCMVAPILQGDRVWGILMAHQCNAPRLWQSWECSLMQQMAGQLAIALQQSQLYQQVQLLNASLEEQVQQRTFELQKTLEFTALLKRITDKVRDSLDETHILQTAVQELALRLDLHSCDTGIYNLQAETSTIVYEYVRYNVPSAQGKTIAFSEFHEFYESLRAGRSLCLCWTTLGSSTRPSTERYASFAQPLSDDQGVIGDLWLYRSAQASFDEAEIWLTQQVASQCAIAIRQARLFQAAQQQVQELERLNRLKDDFLSTVSHELRSPMANIKMATEMLEVLWRRAGVNTEQKSSFDQYFKILRDECRREIDLINDLLTLARLDAETEPLILALVELQSWIPHLTEVFTIRLHHHQQTLVIQIPDDLPPVMTDLDSIERVLSELLHNACKYTPAGGTITIAAEAIATDPLPTIAIHITNSGIEIPASEQHRVFDKFYRIPSNDPWRYGGTGLGLALVKKLVERLQGTITLTSANQQTTFTVQLPLTLNPNR